MIGKKNYIALFCLLTISIFIVPKELIHSFAGHKDSVDSFYNDGSSHIEIKHRHCEMLKYETPIYHNDVNILLLSVAFQSTKYIVNFYDQYVFFSYSHSHSRAPPL